MVVAKRLRDKGWLQGEREAPHALVRIIQRTLRPAPAEEVGATVDLLLPSVIGSDASSLSSVLGADSRESGENPELPRSGIGNETHLEALALEAPGSGVR